MKIEELSEIRIKMSTGSIADSRALRQSLAKAATEKETSYDKALFPREQAVKIKVSLRQQKHGKKEEDEGLLHKHPKNLKTQNVQKNIDKKTTSSKNAAVERVSRRRRSKGRRVGTARKLLFYRRR